MASVQQMPTGNLIPDDSEFLNQIQNATNVGLQQRQVAEESQRQAIRAPLQAITDSLQSAEEGYARGKQRAQQEQRFKSQQALAEQQRSTSAGVQNMNAETLKQLQAAGAEEAAQREFMNQQPVAGNQPAPTTRQQQVWAARAAEEASRPAQMEAALKATKAGTAATYAGTAAQVQSTQQALKTEAVDSLARLYQTPGSTATPSQVNAIMADLKSRGASPAMLDSAHMIAQSPDLYQQYMANNVVQGSPQGIAYGDIKNKLKTYVGAIRALADQTDIMKTWERTGQVATPQEDAVIDAVQEPMAVLKQGNVATHLKNGDLKRAQTVGLSLGRVPFTRTGTLAGSLKQASEQMVKELTDQMNVGHLTTQQKALIQQDIDYLKKIADDTYNRSIDRNQIKNLGDGQQQPTPAINTNTVPQRNVAPGISRHR